MKALLTLQETMESLEIGPDMLARLQEAGLAELLESLHNADELRRLASALAQ